MPGVKNPVERLLQFVYDHLNACYGFRDLYRAKVKYSPTQWVPSYYAYLPKYPTPGMFYATVEIQNPHGIRGYMVSFFKRGAAEMEKVTSRKGVADTPEAWIYYKRKRARYADPYAAWQCTDPSGLFLLRETAVPQISGGPDGQPCPRPFTDQTLGRGRTDHRRYGQGRCCLLDSLHIDACILLGFSERANIALGIRCPFPVTDDRRHCSQREQCPGWAAASRSPVLPGQIPHLPGGGK